MGEDKVFLPRYEYKQNLIEAQVLSHLDLPLGDMFVLSCDKCRASYWSDRAISIGRITSEVTLHIRVKHTQSKITDEDIYAKARLLVRWCETKRRRAISDARRQTEFSDI